LPRQSWGGFLIRAASFKRLYRKCPGGQDWSCSEALRRRVTSDRDLTFIFPNGVCDSAGHLFASLQNNCLVQDRTCQRSHPQDRLNHSRKPVSGWHHIRSGGPAGVGLESLSELRFEFRPPRFGCSNIKSYELLCKSGWIVLAFAWLSSSPTCHANYTRMRWFQKSGFLSEAIRRR
jgi:hypothetical protein